MQNGGTPDKAIAMQWLVWSELSYLLEKKLTGLLLHLIWSFGTYTEPPGFKKNPDVVYMPQIFWK